jgi:DUF4097 and DUF4098 domain-containing protein YvlB
MTKPSKIILSIIFILAAAVAGEIIAVTHSAPSSASSSGQTGITSSSNSSNSFFFQSDRINEIRADLSGCSIKIASWDEPKIQVNVTSNLPRKDQPYALLENNAVVISEDEDTHRFSKTSLEIFVPKSPAGQAGTFTLSLSSSGGSVKAENITCTSLAVHTESGSIIIEDCSTDSLSLESSSGSISCTSCTASSSAVKSASGGIRFEGSTGKTALSSVSGSIRLDAEAMIADGSSFSAETGSITLRLPENSGYTLSFRTDSGRIKDAFTSLTAKGSGTDTYASGTTAFTAATASGNIYIEKK